ncbi:MAG: bifunctional diaminohydroxyphosphoribosylaminopyrimidine deaminase/5-amino-6-(5-phosphoribosylamino)uracil reductase RibD [Cyanobacteria bacterium P01_H01_bin.74]
MDMAPIKRNYNSLDELYIARCIELARFGYATVSPNPMVGCVILDKAGVVVGEGYHQKAGSGHAEVIALNHAGEKARGGTLYVNLEPCNHQGRTGPCTQPIIDAGIARVVCGTLDTNPQVAGAGRDALQNARISVRYGFLEEACKTLNRVFFHYIQAKEPYVSIKLAMTLDGKIASRHGHSKWITNETARQSVHYLRHAHDAILTTAETVMADDPALSVRNIPIVQKQPIKIILDRSLKLDIQHYKVFQNQPIDNQAFNHQEPGARQAGNPSVHNQEKPPEMADDFDIFDEDADQMPAINTGQAADHSNVWIVTSTAQESSKRFAQLRELGFSLIAINETYQGLHLPEVMTALGERGITSILVEAGGQLVYSLMQAKCVNHYYLYYAPKLLQDTMAKPGFGQGFSLDFPDSPQLSVIETTQLDTDVLIEAVPLKQ